MTGLLFLNAIILAGIFVALVMIRNRLDHMKDCFVGLTGSMEAATQLLVRIAENTRDKKWDKIVERSTGNFVRKTEENILKHRKIMDMGSKPETRPPGPSNFDPQDPMDEGMYKGY